LKAAFFYCFLSYRSFIGKIEMMLLAKPVHLVPFFQMMNKSKNANSLKVSGNIAIQETAVEEI